MTLNGTEDDTFRILRKQPIEDMFDEMVKFLPDELWSDDGMSILPKALLRLQELGWTQEEFYTELNTNDEQQS